MLYSLSTPRNIPIPLRAKVQEELVSMEAAAVISRMDKPIYPLVCRDGGGS